MRLITTLTDHHGYPGAFLVRLYHERWEIESACYAPRHAMPVGRVLRAKNATGQHRGIVGTRDHMPRADVSAGELPVHMADGRPGGNSLAVTTNLAIGCRSDLDRT